MLLAVLWIRIRVDPPYFANLDPHPVPDPHQSDKLDPEPDPDPHQFADNKPKCMEYEHFLRF
jgi:hypothetical protein